MTKSGYGKATAISRSHGIRGYKEWQKCGMCRHWINDACLLANQNPEKDETMAAYCRNFGRKGI